jgi:HCOMODA/2-hydroxy-3-carboxy-muconic semialdehyde decarboxylase
MLVIKPEEGASLARALGKHWMVLMMRHGVTVAGTSVRDCVFRSVYSARNAAYQIMAMTIGSEIATLSPGETMLAGQISSKTTGLTRSWEYWSMRVPDRSGEASTPARAKSSPKKRSAPARKSSAKRGRKKRR